MIDFQGSRYFISDTNSWILETGKALALPYYTIKQEVFGKQKIIWLELDASQKGFVESPKNYTLSCWLRVTIAIVLVVPASLAWMGFSLIFNTNPTRYTFSGNSTFLLDSYLNEKIKHTASSSIGIFNKLPEELLRVVFKFAIEADPHAVGSLQRVCKKFFKSFDDINIWMFIANQRKLKLDALPAIDDENEKILSLKKKVFLYEGGGNARILKENRLLKSLFTNVRDFYSLPTINFRDSSKNIDPQTAWLRPFDFYLKIEHHLSELKTKPCSRLVDEELGDSALFFRIKNGYLWVLLSTENLNPQLQFYLNASKQVTIFPIQDPLLKKTDEEYSIESVKNLMSGKSSTFIDENFSSSNLTYKVKILSQTEIDAQL